MLPFLSLRLPRLATMLIAGAFLLVAAVLGALYLWSPTATLRITTGPSGGEAARFISAFIAATEASHPRIRFEPIAVDDLTASSKALEDGKVSIAIVRTDVAPPLNGQSLAILRRDVIAIVLPPASKMDGVSQLAGKTVAIPQGPVQEENSRALDLILGYFNVAPAKVKRLILPLSEIGPAIRDKRAAAVLAVGPVGPGQAVDVVASVARATRGTPKILALDEGDAIGMRYPGFEAIDIPQGAFRGRPATPGEDIKGLAVTYRFAVPARMLNAVAGALARSILKTKARLMALSPLASQIEAPDPDQKNPVLPIHPGVAAYLANGDQSFFDEFQTYLYAIGIPLSILGSAAAMLSGFLRERRLQADQSLIFRLLVIADETAKVDLLALEALEHEFKTIVATCVGELAEGRNGTDQAAVALAIEHARRSIDARRNALSASPARGMVEAGVIA